MERFHTFSAKLTSWHTSLRRKIKFTNRNWNLPLLIPLGVCGFILFREFLVYFVWSLLWPSMTCGIIRELQSVLLVASPRILGESTETWFSRWNDDRYLRRSFAAAVRHVKPDLIIFLGDLMDEGSLANDEEYQRYFERFKEIFQLDYIPASKTVFLPGDSDIGRDLIITDQRKKRFKHHFRSPTVQSLANIQIIQVDRLQQSLPPSSLDSNWTRIVVSQSPLLAAPDTFTAKVLQGLRPHAIVSAQDYTDMSPEDEALVQFSGDVNTGKRLTVETMTANWCIWGSPPHGAPSWRFQWSNRQVVEIVVPTCSSRIRIAERGYGVAIIDKRKEAWCYHVLWLPSRIYMIATYLFTLVVMLVIVVGVQCSRRYNCHSRYKSHPQYKPL
ncbi:cell division control protein 1-like [Homalodisca vitripennis]|uniref:cell division control protein 1-like n=1 Tax=Homalodisca vitripennis TaxID=197043 RepID=UPI001EEC65B6|nr:cell division control protein 1-like [Homalodisca vitripennis]